ncbi:radical SAM protein, partial [candidate division WOR-3 bacterium]|nr:radical SAM protein [candidate division WOR-3 bacterium]
GKYVRFRSREHCMEEIDNVLTTYNVKTLYFNDDVFTLNREFVIDFCREYKRRFKMPFHINTRVEKLDGEMCRALRDAGCSRMDIGIESGSEDFRREVLKRDMRNSEIIKCFRMARDTGIKTKSFNIVGFPCETPGIAGETVQLNQLIKPDSLVVYIFEPYPGTELFETAKSKGFLKSSPWEESFEPRTDTVLDMPEFKREDIRKIYRNFGFNVYRNTSILKALFYKVYYSEHGELILRLFSPFKKILRKLVMGV